MVLEGLGVRNKHNLDSHHDQLRYTLRMAYYGTSPEDDATKMSMPEHRDYVMTSMMVQHHIAPSTHICSPEHRDYVSLSLNL
jgi:hypothetical protein